MFLPRQAAVRFHDDAIDRANTHCQWVDAVNDGKRRHFVRDRQIAAGKAQYRKCAQGLFQFAGFNGQKHITAAQTMLGDPVVVNDG